MKVKNETLELKTPFPDKKFLVYTTNDVYKALKGLKGYWEPHIMSILKLIIKEDSVCFDLGANVGLISLFLSYLAKKGQVFAFEPSSTNFFLLKKNKEINNAENLFIFKLCVYDKTSDFDFFEKNPLTSCSHLVINKNYYFNRKVTCVKLDEWLVDKDISRVDFLKLDIEGAEIKALNGSLNLIEKFKPDLILEFNSKALLALKEEPIDLFNLLLKIYPKLYLIYPYMDFDSVKLKRVDNFDSFIKTAKKTRYIYRIKNYIQAELFCTFKDYMFLENNFR